MNVHVEAEIAEIMNGFVARVQPGATKLTFFDKREDAVAWVAGEVYKAITAEPVTDGEIAQD